MPSLISGWSRHFITPERKQPEPAGFWTLMQTPLKLFFMVVLSREVGHICSTHGTPILRLPVQVEGKNDCSAWSSCAQPAET